MTLKRRSMSVSRNAAAHNADEMDLSPSFRTNPNQSPCHHQHKSHSISYGPHNRPLDLSTTLSHVPNTSTTGDSHTQSDVMLPKTVATNRKPSEIHKQGRMRLLELPLDVLCLVADHLDSVARACLKYADPALGCWSEEDPASLSLCAKSRIISLLQRDEISIPKELLGVAKNGIPKNECSEYEDIVPKYCVVCRCEGHLSRCPECRTWTCAREDHEFWLRWTRNMDDSTVILTGTMH